MSISNKVLCILVTSLLCFLPLDKCVANAVPTEDAVEFLPLFGKPPTSQYSGYLNATEGCDTNVNGECYIHYWFAAAEGSCCEPKPTLLWLNGGPGSSSVLGFLQELGPLLFNATGGLMKNPYAWTKVANVLVLESPIGVGYSYCTAQLNGGVCQNTDKYTASASRAALVDFFTNKFPELVLNDFYITGESYAGVYVPTLAYEILTNAKKDIPNLKGLAVGDPCTDNDSQRMIMDPLWYGHQYGLVDDAIFDTLWNKCGYRIRHLNQHQSLNKAIKFPVSLQQQRFDRNNLDFENEECDLAYRKFLLSTSGGLSQGWKDLYIDDYSLFAPVTNAEDKSMEVYMNRADVRLALHVHDSINQWPRPRSGFHYTKEYSACNHYAEDGTLSMIDFYRKIAPKLDRVWVYNGDTDPCVSYEGTRTAVKRIGFNEIDGGGYRPWFYNLTATSIDVVVEKAVMFGPDLVLYDVGAQFGGEVVNYENNLAFFTVHGSGHMVPQFRPQAALHFVTKFVNGLDLSPLLPTNSTLASMADDEFELAMESWTEIAKNSPYVDVYETTITATTKN